MSSYHIHPDNYSEDEILEIKKVAFIDTKLSILETTLESLELIEDKDLRFDLESKIAAKIGRLLDKI
jgi:hypothetical protein